MCYEKWNTIKPQINPRFTEVATIYAIDMKSGGGRPSNNDEKYAVFGHPVKFLRHPSDHIGNNLLINLRYEIHSVPNMLKMVSRFFKCGIG